MQELLSLLSQGLSLSARQHAAATLGDRTKYVGMSDIGKAADCLRAAVAGKLPVPAQSDLHHSSARQNHNALLRELRMRRGHWFENGVAEAFQLAGRPVLHQMSIHTRRNRTPIVAHLDFVLIAKGETPRVQIVELKSTEQIPETAYAAHEVQLFGQMGLMEALWNRPGFMVQPGPLRTFPDLVRRACGINLPEQVEKVVIEGAILMLSMNEARVFGPYSPNAIMRDVCLNLAEKIWESVEQVHSGKANLNDLPTVKGWHPLCDCCEWNADCPRFDGINMPELEQDLLNLQALKTEKDAAIFRVQEAEERLKQVFQGISPGRDWVNALTQRFRVGTCDGRKTLDKDRLLTALSACLSGDKAEALVAAGYKTSEPYERLYVGHINGG